MAALMIRHLLAGDSLLSQLSPFLALSVEDMRNEYKIFVGKRERRSA
jgi:hypothetical protein